MLAHFEDLNFTPLLEDLNMRHVLLLDLFYRYFCTSLNMHCHFYKTKLTFAKSFFEFVKIKDVTVIHYCLKSLDPNLLLLGTIEEQNINLVWRDTNSNRVILVLGLRADLCLSVCFSRFNEA